MDDFDRYKKKLMQDPEFEKEYNNSRDEFEILRAIIETRLSLNMTQKELSEKSGIRQSNISRIESGTTSPTITTLIALAKGMNKKLMISLQ